MPQSDELRNELDEQSKKNRKTLKYLLDKRKRKKRRKKVKAALKTAKAVGKAIAKFFSFLVSNPIGWGILFIILLFILLFLFLGHMPALVTIPDIHGSKKQTGYEDEYSSVNKATDDSGSVKEAYSSYRDQLNFTHNGEELMPEDESGGSSGASGSAAKLLDTERKYLGKTDADAHMFTVPMGGNPNDPWCAYFIAFCAKESGISDSVIKYTGSVAAQASAAKSDGTWRDASSYTPVPGDLCFFSPTGCHIGTVESVSSDGSITTIEGNSSDQCKRNTYKNKSRFSGFRHPNYSDTSNSSSDSEESATDEVTEDDYRTLPNNFYDSVAPGWQTSQASDEDILNKMLEARKKNIKDRVTDDVETKYQEKAAGGYFFIACFSASFGDYVLGMITDFNIKDLLLTAHHRFQNALKELVTGSTIDKDVTVQVPALYIKYKKDSTYELNTKKSKSDDADTVYVKSKKEYTGRDKIVENWDDTPYDTYKPETVREAVYYRPGAPDSYFTTKPSSGETVSYEKGDMGRPSFHDKTIYKKDQEKVAKVGEMNVHVHKTYRNPFRKAMIYSLCFGYPSQNYEGDSDGDDDDSDSSSMQANTKDAASFYKANKKIILKGWKKYHLYPSVTIAQAQTETSFGNAGAGKPPINNIYGVSGSKDYGSPYWNSSMGTDGRPEGGVYHKYPDQKHAIGDRNYWLGTMSNYVNVRNANSATEQAIALANSGWAAAGYKSKFADLVNKYKKYDKDLPKSDYDPNATPETGKNQSADATGNNGTGGYDGIKGKVSGNSMEENLQKLQNENEAVIYNIKRFWTGSILFKAVHNVILGGFFYPDGDTIRYAPYGKYNKSGIFNSVIGTETYDDVLSERARVLKAYLHDDDEDDSLGSYIWPFDYNKYGTKSKTIVSHFGDQSSSDTNETVNHKGIDIAWDKCEGADIRACASGTVIYAGSYDEFGNIIEIQHDHEVVTQYGNMKDSDMKVKTGDTVTQGDTIAQVGNEGSSTSPHLHLGAMRTTATSAVYENYFDPLELFTKEEHPEGKNPGTSSGSLTGNSDAEKVFNYFVSKGFTNQAAAGIVGNLMQESSCNPKSTQKGGPGRGIAQWSVNERWASLLKWKGSRDEWDLATQLDWLYHEMQTTESASMGVKNITDVHQATLFFEQKFERAGAPNMTNRYKYADQAYNSWADRS